MTKLYRAALWILPPRVRSRHGVAMAAVFADLVTDARRRRGRLGVAWCAAAELASLVRFAWCEWRGATPPPRIDERQFIWTPETERTTPMRGLLTQDLRYAVRMLARTPGVTVVCIATIALAIGAVPTRREGLIRPLMSPRHR